MPYPLITDPIEHYREACQNATWPESFLKLAVIANAQMTLLDQLLARKVSLSNSKNRRGKDTEGRYSTFDARDAQ